MQAMDQWIWHRTAVPIFVERFLLPLFAAVVVLLAVTNPMGFDKTQRIAGSLSLMLAAYFLAHTIYKNNSPAEPEKLFAANVLLAIGDPSQPFWLLSEQDQSVFPIDLFLKIRVVNLQMKRASIESIGIEIMETTDWITLNKIPIGGMKIFMGGLSTATEFRVSPPDIGEVFSSEMEPGARLAATGFFESSQLAFQLPAHPRFRITIKDTTGRLSVFETEVPLSDRSELDMTKFQKIGDRDLSHFRQQRF